MNKIFYTLIICILTIQLSYTQNIDSLRSLIKSEKNDSIKIKHYSKLGYIYQKASNYDSAYFLYTKSNILAKELFDTSQIIVTQFQISKVLYWMSFHNKADSLLKESMKLAVLINDTASQTHIFTSLGVNALKMNDTLSALNYYTKALDLTSNKDISEKGNIYANLGQISRSQNKLDKALYYFSLSEEIWKQLNKNSYIARIQFEKAQVFYAQQNYKKAIQYYQTSLLLDSVNPFRTIQSWKYKRLSEAYLKINKFDSAYYFLEKHYLMQNDIYNEKRIQNIKELELKYEKQIHQKENIALKKQNDLNIQVIKTKNNLFNGSILVLFLVILIIILLFRSFRNVKKANILLEQQKDEISTQSKVLEKTNERLKELDEHKQTLTAMLIHDLSNPLHVIKSTTTNDNIVNTVNQMILMVDNLLTIQKFEDKSLHVDMFDYQLNYLVNNAINQTLVLANNKNIIITNTISEEIFINADSFLLERIFINLISNAIRFTKNDGKITIDAEIIEKESVLVRVIDTGAGISKENIGNVFDKYSKSKKKSGSQHYGLGLSFCKMAVESMNGQISVKSKEGEGSLFSFSLSQGQKLNAKSINLDIKNTELHDDISFSDIEKSQMSEYLLELQKLEIYELTEIKKILKEIRELDGENIKEWLTLIENSIYSSNDELFHQLINIK